MTTHDDRLSRRLRPPAIPREERPTVVPPECSCCTYDEPPSAEEEQAAVELEPALAARRRAEAGRLAALARRAPLPRRGCRPYARPAGVRSAAHHCSSCGDVLLPSYVRAYRIAAHDSLAVPEQCWHCVEAQAADAALLRKAIG